MTDSSLTLNIPISLTVAANQTPQPFIIGNNSSGNGNQVAPGEIILIKGANLGPATGTTGISTSLGGVGVTFDGRPATLLYVSASQVDAIVPYEVAGQSSTSMVLTYQSVPSAAIQLPVVVAALGLSTPNVSGTGQAAALNQDYSVNTVANPAAEGSYISLYGTGGGQTNPASTDGEVSPAVSPLLYLALYSDLTATIGGKPAKVVFAGAGPGWITGLDQFDVQVPTGVSGPAVPVVITITMGSTVIQSQAGVTIAVQ